MIGAPKHVKKAIDAGVDIICAQGGEGGGHTGEIPTSVLIPKVCDLVNEIGATSPLTGAPIHVIAAGGIFDGRGLAMALALGASGVWVGTRFVASEEAGAPPRHQKAVVEADYDSTVRTIIFTGRPMRVRKNDMIMNWEENRQDDIRELTGKGILPMAKQAEEDEGKELSFQEQMDRLPLLMGQAAGAIPSVLPAKEIMEEMVATAIATLRGSTETFVTVGAEAQARL
jgi:NAD(P)H-dependent flavin oxidoreductase YrpB (nitropropane dioxygenase family)